MDIYFSIIIPTYNRARLLCKAIDSVLAQTYVHWELLVVDDGSTDNTKAVVEKYVQQDNRVKYIYQKNAERSAARNNGIDKAQGQYLCFLDSDDYFLPERLSLLASTISQMNNPEVLFYTDLVAEMGEKKSVRPYANINSTNLFDVLIQRAIHSQQICSAAIILKQFKYDTQFMVAEDSELWLRIATKYELLYLPNQATVVVVEHDERTVGFNKPDVYLKHIVTRKHIKQLHSTHFSSVAIIDRSIHDGYMGLARSYAHNNKSWNMLAAILNACRFEFFRSAKQKSFLITANFYLFKPFLSFYKWLKQVAGKTS